MTNRVEGFDGVTNVTEWTYYTSGNGKGQVKTEKRQSGLLIQYAYDNVDRSFRNQSTDNLCNFSFLFLLF